MNVCREFRGSDFSKVLSELVLLKCDSDKYYKLEIKEKKKKRSLDANGYCWALLNELSDKLKIPAIELYQEFIRKVGSYEVICINTQAMGKFLEVWQSNGYGWLVDILGESRNYPNCMNLKCYHGSSVYDTKEMSKLIDEIVVECKEQGIETATGAELDLLKRGWRG